MSELEDLKNKVDSRTFSKQDCTLLEQLISSRKEQVSDEYNLLVLNEALETTRICSMMFSKLESEHSGSIRINRTDWSDLGTETIYTKMNAFLLELRSNNIIVSLQPVIGGIFFFRLINRVEYVDFLHKQIKIVMKDVGSLINLDKSSGISTVSNIIKRIDPNLQVLRRWIKGGDSKDFESGVSILLSLCGFNTLHVGDKYESATLDARRTVHKIGKSNLDVIALSKGEKHILLCQCAVDSIENKMGDLVNFTTEIMNNIKRDGIGFYPVIITSVSRAQLVSSLGTAFDNRISVFTIEDLEEMFDGVSSGRSMAFEVLNKLNLPPIYRDSFSRPLE